MADQSSNVGLWVTVLDGFQTGLGSVSVCLTIETTGLTRKRLEAD